MAFREQTTVTNMKLSNMHVTNLTLMQVNVTNVGLRPATGVRVELPNDALMYLVSFGNTEDNSEGDGSLTLAPGDSAILVLGAATSDRQVLGRRSGTLVVRSLQIVADISYR